MEMGGSPEFHENLPILHARISDGLEALHPAQWGLLNQTIMEWPKNLGIKKVILKVLGRLLEGKSLFPEHK